MKPVKKALPFLCRSCNKMRPSPAYANSAKGIMECKSCTPYLNGDL